MYLSSQHRTAKFVKVLNHLSYFHKSFFFQTTKFCPSQLTCDMALKLPLLRVSNNSIDLFKAQQGKSLMTMGLQCQPAVNHVYSNSRQQRVLSGSLSAGSLLALTTACCSLSEAFVKRTRTKDSGLFLSFFLPFIPSFFLLFVQSTDAVFLTA